MTGPVVYVVAQLPKLSQTFVLGEIRELVRQGCDVRVLVLRAPTATDRELVRCDDLADRITVAPSGLRGVAPLTAAALSACVRSPRRALPELLRATRWAVRHHALHELLRFAQAAYLRGLVPADAVHLHAHFAHGPASVAMTLSGLTRVPFSFTAHARDLFCDTAVPVLREKLSAAAFLVAISEHGAQFARTVDSGGTADVVLVRNGIDLAAFRPQRAGRVGTGPFRAVSVCRLVEKKGVDVLLDALVLLRARGLDVPADVVGDGPLRAALQSRARDAGIDDLVTWHGAADPASVRQVLAGAGCFVLPCRVAGTGDADGLPVSIVEALACGLPVVSTRTAGVPEAVADGVSGRLVPQDDPAAVADVLERLATDQAFRRRLAAGALEAAGAFDRVAWVGVLRARFTGQPTAPPAGGRERRQGAADQLRVNHAARALS